MGSTHVPVLSHSLVRGENGAIQVSGKVLRQKNTARHRMGES